MREFGVRRYGDLMYQHCLAETAADAASWFAHAFGIAKKSFQALVKDVSQPFRELGADSNPQVVKVHAGTPGAPNVTPLNRTSPLR